MARLTKAERDRLPDAAFADPSRRLFPLLDQDDVDAAARLIGRAPEAERDAVRKRVLALCTEKGLTPPAAWAEMAADLPAVEFSADAPAAPPAADDLSKTVRRTARVLLREGDYDFPAEKGGPFTVSREDILANCADFNPVLIDDNHRPAFDHNGAKVPPSFFHGKLGRVLKLNPSADYSEAGAEVEVPRWLDRLYAGKPIPLSARWCRATRRVKDVALTHKGKVPDAAMSDLYAAFAMGQEESSWSPESAPDTGTPHGQKLMQYVHDLTAHSGARCKDEHSPALHAEMTAGHEADTIQKLHDATLGSGAACSVYRLTKGMNREWRPGQYFATAVDAMPPYRDYRPGNYALMTDDRAPAGEPAPEPTPRERALAAENDRLKKAARLEQARRAAAEAVAFAAEVRDRTTPPLEALLLEEYQEAAGADADAPSDAAFTDEQGTRRQGTRVERLKARYRALPKHGLAEERLRGGEALFAVPAGGTHEPSEAEEAARSAEEYARRRNGAAAQN